MIRRMMLFMLLSLSNACHQAQEIKVGDCFQIKEYEGLSPKYFAVYRIVEVGVRVVLYERVWVDGKTVASGIESKERMRSDYFAVRCPES